MEENSLAYEMLKELQASRQNLYAIICALIAVIVLMFIGFLWYENQFDYVTTTEQTQKADDINSSDINQIIN